MFSKKFTSFFNPKSIAVIGATEKEGHVGSALMQNLLRGYPGKVYPVNPKYETVLGQKCYKNIAELEECPDLTLIATPNSTVPEIIGDCGSRGCTNIIIYSSGFSEIGEEGIQLYDKVKELIKNFKLNVLGPNCMGFVKPALSLNASFASRIPKKGKIAFISQSGALGSAVMDWAVKENVGLSYFISVGEVIDLGFSDLIDFLGSDPETKCILIYMESLSRARKFLSAARAFARSKPIVILKAGKSLEGAKAAMSHTGSMAGEDIVFDAAFKRAGIIRVSTVNQLFNCAKALDLQKKPEGNRLAIVTNAGGPAVLATDQLISLDGKLAELTRITIDNLDTFLPKNWSRSNPVDVLGDAGKDTYARACDIILSDINCDGLLAILTPQTMTDPEAVAHELVKIKNSTSKTILASWMGEELVEKGYKILEDGGIPVFKTPEEAIKTFMHMYNYGKNLNLLYETPATIPHAFSPDTKNAREYINELMTQDKFLLTEYEAHKLLNFYGMPLNQASLVKNRESATETAKRIGFPVAMKVISPDIIHKTESGGVKLNIVNEKQVEDTYDFLIRAANEMYPDANITGIMVEKMVHKRYELFFGCKKDPIFGPTIIFGMGGIAVEIFKDINAALPPLNMALAKRLIEETKIYKLLKGFRNIKPVDLDALQFILYKFSYLIMDFPEIKEVDINPYVLDEKGGVILDARIILDEKTKGKKLTPYSHLAISPYPKQYIKEFRMKDEKTALLRPIRPEDETLEAEMFKNFSSETQRFRFFSLLKGVTHEMLTRYTQIDYDREMAIIAEVEEEGKKKMAGVVRIIADAWNESAEYAIVVADPWQGKGLGSSMTDYIIGIAREKGIRKIFAYMLSDNEKMIYMLKKRGFSLLPKEGNYYAELKLD